MNKKTRLFYRRIVSFTSSVLLTAQSIFPAFYVLPAYAEEVSPTPTQTESSTTVTPTSTPEVTPSVTTLPTETISPTITTEPTSTATPEVSPTTITTPTEVPSPTENLSPTPTEDQIEVDPTITTIPTETSPPQDSSSNDSQNQNPSGAPASENTSSAPTENLSPTPTETPQTIEPVTLQAIILPDTSAESVLKLDLDTIVETSATVTTDKLDYAPTDTVLITGTNYLPNTTYKLKIISSDEPPVNFETELVSNEEGNIYYSYQLDGTYRPNYQVEVKNTSGTTLATTTFTDSDTGNNNYANQTISSNGVSNPDRGWTSNNQYATFDSASDYVEYGFPDLGIPNGATIDGIEVVLEAQRNGNPQDRNLNAAIWNGSSYTNPKTATLSSNDSNQTLGGSTEKWGKTWTTADFADNTLKIKVGVPAAAYGDADLDSVKVKVYYSTSTVPSILISQINNTSAPFNFVCPTNPLSNPVTISGNGGGSAPPGQIDQYHVQVDWGDGTVTNNLGTFNPNSGQGNFTYSFSTGAHTYTTSGNFTIKARLYHSQPPGNDNQADSTASVTVCIPPQQGNILIQKFEDLDGDHIKDANETGGRIDGWQVSLYSGQNCVGSSINSGTTNSAGQIQFNNLNAGSYSIKETLKPGWQNTTGTNLCQNISVTGGNTTTTYLGNQRNYVNLSITKTDDVDPVYAGEIVTYTINWTKNSNTDANITLKETPSNNIGTPIDYTTTGYLNPTWVYCGSHTYCKDLGTKVAGSQSGSETFKVQTLSTATAGNKIYNTTFIIPTYISWAGESTNDGQQVAEQYTTVAVRPGAIRIIKDSQPEDGQNFIFTLYKNDGQGNYTRLNSAELDDDGENYFRPNNYTFSNLSPGGYKVEENSVSGWKLADITCVSDGQWGPQVDSRLVNIDVLPNKTVTCTFTNKKLGSISGHKWNDEDGDGRWDWGENGLSNWTIFIDKDRDGYNGTLDSDETRVTTDHDGDYSLGSLSEGTYRICEVEKSENGWSNTTGGICKDVTLSVGENKTSINFGNRQRGSIRVCKIITDGSGNVVNGSDLPTTTFNIRWDKLNTTTFTSGYNPNAQILSTSDGDDAYCTTYSNLPIDNYHYYAETISGSTGWLTAKYNDQFDTSVNDLDDFYAYGSNTDSNGDINLALDAGVNRTLVILNQYSLGNLDVIKFLDYDGDGVKDDNGNEYQMPDWDMEVYSGSGCTGQIISNGSKPTNSNGVASFANLVPGNYSVKENMGDRTDWINTTPTCQNVTVRGGQTSIIYVGNFQKGTVMGCKYDDVNGSGVRSGKETNEGVTEPQLSGWTIRLYNSDWEKVGETVTNPYFYFNNVMEKGTYYLCEQMQSGWRQTEPVNGENYGYTAVQNQSGDSTEGELCKQVTVDNSGFYGSHYYGFGNQRVDAKLTISRTNNASVALAPGNAVEHTITIHVDDNNINNLKLTDLLPKGFTFRPMSYTVLRNLTTDITSSIPSPEYHSPGVWTLGNFSKDDTITIKYWADIDSGQQSGIYKDLAWATATDAYGQNINYIAQAENPGQVTERFVGTEVTVNKDIVNEVGVDVEKKETKEGAVLGASTDLPATGANELWLILAIILLAAGSTSIYQTTKSHKHV